MQNQSASEVMQMFPYGIALDQPVNLEM